MVKKPIEILVAEYLTDFLLRMRKTSLRRFVYRVRERGRRRKKIQNLLYNVISYLRSLDRIISPLLAKEDENSDEFFINLLRVLAYRIIFQRIPGSTIFEKIKDYFHSEKREKLKRFITEIKEPRLSNEVDKLSFIYGFPQWMIERIKPFFSPDELRRFLSACNKRGRLWIIINALKASEEKVIQLLENERFELEKDSEIPYLYSVVKIPKRIDKTKAYCENLILPMNKASAAVVFALNPRPGEVIFDMCAAPGIKTVYTSILTENQGSIIAVDISKPRIRRMQHLIKSYGVTNVRIMHADAREIFPRNVPDKILIDAPCSSTGMIRESPDIKWRAKYNDVVKFATLQEGLIEHALKIADSTTQIIFSTCSIFPEEGEEIIERLLIKGKIKLITDALPGGSPYYNELGKRFYPHIHDTIGLYYAKFAIKM
ncbi:MAG: RsmB/NOP family class I SAM-dependent RNA methyltransferase [Candidatus Njordarchaeales archaeon]